MPESLRARFLRYFFGPVQISVLDQIVISATRFLAGLLLLRNAPAQEYGLYVLLFSIILLAISVQNALITTPLTVLAPAMEPVEQSRFVRALAKGQYLIWLPLLIFVPAGVALWQPAETPLMFGHEMVLAATLFFVLAREFLRRSFFVISRPGQVLRTDVLDAALLFALLIGLLPGNGLTAQAVIAVMGLSAMVASIFAVRFFFGVFDHSAGDVRAALRRCWVFGRWALLGVVVTWLQMQGFLFLLDFLQTREDVGHVSAVRMLAMPVMVFNTALIALYKPRSAALLARAGEAPAARMLRRMVLLSGSGCLVWFALIAAGQGLLQELVLKTRIPDYGVLLALWAGVFLLQIIRTGFSAYLQIRHQFKALFYVGAAAAFVSLAAGWLFIIARGAAGSLWGVLAGEVVFVLGLMILARRPRQQG